MIALIIIGLLIIIFSFTILTVAGRHYVKNGDSYEQKRGAFMKKLRWMISVPVAVIMAVVLLVSGIRIIDSTEVGVVRTWGQINREIDAVSSIQSVNLYKSMTCAFMCVRHPSLPTQRMRSH